MNRLKYFLIVTLFIPLTTFAQTPSWFTVVTDSIGLTTQKGGGIYAVDINNDDYPDLVTVTGDNITSNRYAMQVYLNMPNTDPNSSHPRKFVDYTATSNVNASPTGDTSRHIAVGVLADFDNDGDVDLVTSTYYHRIETATDFGDRTEIMLNDGNGVFSFPSHTELHDLGWLNTVSIATLDFNKDGNLDIYIANWSTDHTNNNFMDDNLVVGFGNGSFSDVSSGSGILGEPAWPNYGVSTTDWNNDGWADVLIGAYCRNGGYLWSNNADNTYTNVAATANYNSQFLPGDAGQALCNWGAYPADFDNDGDFDMYFSLVHGGNGPGEGKATMVINEGPDSNYHLHWGLGLLNWEAPNSAHRGNYDASWIDIDNDGLQDLMVTQGTYAPATDHLYVFRQLPDHSFDDISTETGLVSYTNTGSIQVFDYDLDGDDDVILQSVGASGVTIFRNDIGQDNNYVSVKLEPQSNLINGSCIGARIKVYKDTLIQTKEIYAGRNNGGGQQPFITNFGIGAYATVDSIVVEWPDIFNTVTTLVNPPINQQLNIHEGGIVGINETTGVNNNIDFKVYPSPASSVVSVSFNQEIPNSLSIYSLEGKVVQTVNSISNHTMDIDVSKLQGGIYYIQCNYANSRPVIQKVVISN